MWKRVVWGSAEGDVPFKSFVVSQHVFQSACECSRVAIAPRTFRSRDFVFAVEEIYPIHRFLTYFGM